MRAVTFQGIKRVEVKDVPDPVIKKPDDIILCIINTAICGPALHLIHDMVPNLEQDYVIGHEPMGIVEKTGPDVTRVKKAIKWLSRLTSAAVIVITAKPGLPVCAAI